MEYNFLSRVAEANYLKNLAIALKYLINTDFIMVVYLSAIIAFWIVNTTRDVICQ